MVRSSPGLFPVARPDFQTLFTHILNLVVKVILRQFDVPKAKAGEALDVASQALADLAGNIDLEEAAMKDGDDGDDGDNVDDREELG